MARDCSARLIQAAVGLVESAGHVTHHRSEQPPPVRVELAAARLQLLVDPCEQLPQALLSHRPGRCYGGPPSAGPEGEEPAAPVLTPSSAFQLCSRPRRLPFSVSFSPSGESVTM